MKKQIKKGLKWSLFLLSSAVFASPLAIPHNSSKLYPTITKGSVGVGSDNGQLNGQLQDIVLVYNNKPGAYHTTSPINLRAYLSYFYNYGDYNPKLVVYIAGGQGGGIPYEGNSTFVGGTGGITIFTAPLSKIVRVFGSTVSFYYVVGGEGLINTTSLFANTPWPGSNETNDHWGGGGGGASMVAVKNWPHDGGITLAIAGGGGGSGNDAWGGGSIGGGGGGGNDCGENAPIGISDRAHRISGLGGCHGQGGGDSTIVGGQANPNLIDISGGGGGAYFAPGSNGGAYGGDAGSGGGTGTAGNGGTSILQVGGGGCGYQPGGDGDASIPSCPGDPNYSGGYSPDGGYGGFGGGGGTSEGSGAGGGGGYGGGGGSLRSGAGGGGGYCLDANHSPPSNPSLGAELGSTCQASDWTNGGGNYGNGYVYIYIEP